MDFLHHDHPPPGVVPIQRYDFVVNLGKLIRGIETYSMQDLIQAMNQNTTLTNLRIAFGLVDQPTAARMQRAGPQRGLIQFLLQYIANRNHLHLHLLGAHIATSDAGLLDVFNQFVMAAAQSETIDGLCLEQCSGIPVQTLVGLSRANRNIKALGLEGVAFVSGNDLEMSELTSTTTLERLVLYGVKIERSAERMFLELTRYLKPKALVLDGAVFFHRSSDCAIATSLISALMNARPVEHLRLRRECNDEMYRAALTAGKSVVKRLSVHLVAFRDLPIQEKFDVLTRMMPDNLESFQFNGITHAQHPLPPPCKARLLRALDASTTLTEINVRAYGGGSHFSQEEMRLLQDGRIGRNNDLGRFERNPDAYPERDLLVLMLQMENSLTGLFKIVRNIPARFRRNQA